MIKNVLQVIVSAKKPEFFQISHPLYEVVTEDGLMRPCFKARSGIYSLRYDDLLRRQTHCSRSEFMFLISIQIFEFVQMRGLI